MFLARIHGTLTSTVKHPTVEGYRLLIGRRMEADLSESGDPLVLVDLIGARLDSTVLVTTDNEQLRRVMGDTTPARLLIVGMVDQVGGVAQ